MKTILSIQDLSCVGRCSLTVALPVLSAMGHRCSVLPTAILSTHTGFPDPVVLPLTDHINSIGTHFAQVGVAFDAVTVGYLSDGKQAQAVLPLLQAYKNSGSLIIADPAMGDHGKLYRGLGADHVSAMAQICAVADILLPNVTEAALLADVPYCETPDEAALHHMAQRLLAKFPAKTVLITGVSGSGGRIGFYGLHRDGSAFSHQEARVDRQFHGTGDLFAAVFTGAYLSGRDCLASGALAARFVRTCVDKTPIVTPHGVAFEPLLPTLWAQLQEKSC